VKSVTGLLLQIYAVFLVPVEPSEDPGPDMELCTFENGFCRWISLPSAEVQWMRHQGSTPTRETGPSVDHTLGTENGGFVYLLCPMLVL
jgi:hypothetical protein